MQFIWGFIITGIGILTVIFSEQIYNFTGAIDFIEKHAAGSSRGFIKLFGVVLVVLGILIFSGAVTFITNPLSDWAAQTFRLNQ